MDGSLPAWTPTSFTQLTSQIRDAASISLSLPKALPRPKRSHASPLPGLGTPLQLSGGMAAKNLSTLVQRGDLDSWSSNIMNQNHLGGCSPSDVWALFPEFLIQQTRELPENGQF